MKYLFILGRNPDLSIAEIKSVFGKSLKNFLISKNAMILDLEEKIPRGILKNLGGTLAIAEVLASGEISEMQKNLDKIEICSQTKNNFNYVIWNFSNEEFYNGILNYLKERFRNEKFKPTRKNLTGRMEMQSGESVEISGQNMDEEYFIFSDKEENFFGKIIEKTDYVEIEKRDMQKPVRREELAISPRLAKIMINLSQVMKGERLVDPFCGIGVILQEALLQGIKVVGIDKDEKAVEGARQNLNWKKFSKENFELINADSSKVKIKPSNAIVSEPDLGIILRKMPNKKQAGEILTKYENLVISVINNLKKNISGKIVLTSPYMTTVEKKRTGCDVARILSKTGLKIVAGFPIEEFRKGQIVGRRILVLER